MAVRGSFNPAEATHGGGGDFKEGWIKVVKSYFGRRDYNPPGEKAIAAAQAKGEPAPEQVTPKIALIWEIRLLDVNLRDTDAETKKIYWNVGEVAYKDGNAAFSIANNPNPADPTCEFEDLGSESETTGNAYVSQTDKQPSRSSAFMRFMEAAVKAGIKPDILARASASDWDGVVCYLTAQVFQDGNYKQVVPLILKSDQIKVHPGEAVKPAAKKTAAKPTAIKTSKAAPVVVEDDPFGDDDDDAATEEVEVDPWEPLAIVVLNSIAKKSAGSTQALPTLASKMIAMKAKIEGSPKAGKAGFLGIQKLLKDVEWVEAQLTAAGHEVADGRVTFA